MSQTKIFQPEVPQELNGLIARQRQLFLECINNENNKRADPLAPNPELAELDEKIAQERERLCYQFIQEKAHLEKSTSK